MTDPFDFTPRPMRFAVMGNPVAHSKSPQIHAMFAEQCGIRLEYERIQADPGGFDQAVSNFEANGGRGLNITVPFKLEAFRLATSTSDRARRAEAVNTLAFREGGERFGDNTDGAGLLHDLESNLDSRLRGRRVLMLGAGGAVRGVLEPLLGAGPAQLVLANRTVDKAVALAAHFRDLGGIEACGFERVGAEPFDVILNGTAASLSGDVPPIPGGAVGGQTLAYDLMYADEPTPFMRWALEQGAGRAVDGLGMLVEQAAESFHVWHGVRPDTAPVIAALRA